VTTEPTTVLVVNDEISVHQALTEMLMVFGYDVEA
jgi:FixJ family two-component response regulator